MNLIGLALLLLVLTQGCLSDHSETSDSERTNTDLSTLNNEAHPKDSLANSDSTLKTVQKTDFISNLDSAQFIHVFPIPLDSTWESLFIQNPLEIPRNEFNAFYFQDSLTTLISYSDTVPFPTLNYSDTVFHGI